MVDQDWMDSSNPGTWTDESRHPDTQLNYANEFDLNIKGWLLNEPITAWDSWPDIRKAVIALRQRWFLYLTVLRRDSEMISAPSRMEKGQSATNNVLKCPTLADWKLSL
ncbi:outer membrane protease [Escherichia coli]|uniref:Outer membrane protease n=1 Tax=Escherichia coli TaxID=562 RepID=A0A376TJB9_ECOLX|nr:outer membrane protease [Escherichia coli]